MTRKIITADAVMTGSGVIGDTLVVEDGRISEITTGTGPDADQHHDGVIVPPFVDSHIHPFEYVAAMGDIRLGTPTHVDEILATLEDAHAELPSEVALIATGLDDSRLGRMPTAAELDAVSDRRPILVGRVCGHVASANSATLRMAGIYDGTPDPEGGTIRRGADGSLNGIVEETAVDSVFTVLDPITPQPSTDAVVTVLSELVGMGLSRLGAMCEVTPTPTEEGLVGSLRALDTEMPLILDVIAITSDPSHLVKVKEGLAECEKSRFWGWKGFADGSLGGRTAWLSEPYQDATQTRGIPRLEHGHALEMTMASLRLGGISAIHAIGDAALTMVLDVFEEAISQGAEPTRLRVEHVSVAPPQMIERMARLGVIASVQPSFPVSDEVWLEQRLGRQRQEWAYPFRQLIDAGIPVIFSSDAPVESPDVVTAMSHAMASGITPAEALAGYTSTPGRLLGVADPFQLGTPADFVVIDGIPGAATRVVRREQ